MCLFCSFGNWNSDSIFSLLTSFYFFASVDFTFLSSINCFIVFTFFTLSSSTYESKDSFDFLFCILLQIQYKTTIPTKITPTPITTNKIIIFDEPFTHFPSERVVLESHSTHSFYTKQFVQNSMLHKMHFPEFRTKVSAQTQFPLIGVSLKFLLESHFVHVD